ncbi:MAG: PHP domain-containing protein [Candidatus Pacebacteria bacterium]|nr:PHP domain-containing protein [Candidatus Paceibacterota bacterium]
MIIKGACHLHSKYSYDGKLSLSQIKDLFSKKGLSFVCMTEHTNDLTEEKAQEFIKECRELSDEEFIFIPGFEVSYGGAHLLMIGSDKFISQHVKEADLLKWLEDTEFVVLAHPHKNNYKINKNLKRMINGLEVWNSQYDGKFAPRFRSFIFLKKLQRENNIRAFAGLDFHKEEHFGNPIVFVDVKTLSKIEILNAFKSGNYTFGKDKIVFSSRGDIQQGNLNKLFIQSFLSINFICFSKWINKNFVKMGLSIPKNLKKKIRSKI